MLILQKLCNNVKVTMYTLHHSYRKSSHVQYKSTSDAAIVQSGKVHPGEIVYEDPDRTAATTTPREFRLTECPAYAVTTTVSSPQPSSTTEAQLQSGYYEL